MDWTNEVDYFYAQNWTGAVLGTRGAGGETQVTFNGYTSGSTGWLSYDKEISPAPEPATYGALFVGISLLGLVVYRRRSVLRHREGSGRGCPIPHCAPTT